MSKRYFVTGIDTDSGKTVVSAILVQKLQADYWKPVQAGTPTDSNHVGALIDRHLTVHPEEVVLQAPMSPHAAADLEGRHLHANDFEVPATENTLIIEGAGGLMVPINNREMVIQLAQRFQAEVILVSRNYLGSINHTLLSIAYLQSNGYDIKGIIFNDTPNPSTESVILSYSGLECLGHIGHLDEITPETIKAEGININLQ